MKLFKNSFFYVAFLTALSSVSFSAELPSFHIVVLDDSTSIEKAPFASRVHILKADLENDEESEGHGAAVCSVLVGQNSPLPENISITFAPSLDQFSSYINDQKAEDLVILNWSGIIGLPGLPEELVEELENLNEHFNTILKMDKTKLPKEASIGIETYQNILAQLPSDNNPFSELLNYLKESLSNLVKQPSQIEQDRDTYLRGASEKIETFKKHAEEQANLRYGEMKAGLHTALKQHGNTLIIWALGNEGECIDTHPFWQGVLSDGLILSHTILVYGLRNHQKEPESNFTNIYNKHALGKLYKVEAWDAEKLCYVQLCGTSFSAPLATIDAFTAAKEMLNQTGRTPSYADVKQALLLMK